MNRSKTLLLLVALASLTTSCEKLLMSADMPASPTLTFHYLWQKVDQQYAMFDVKPVDWNAVYDSLMPLVHDDMTSDSLFAVCSAMLRTLDDGHVNLVAAYDVSHADSLYYRFYSESGVDINTVVLNYLTPSYHTTGGIAHNALSNGRVIYARYGSFSSSISENQLRYIVGHYPQAEGMILDLRGNGGGNLTNVSHLLSIMPSHGQVLYYSQIKRGPAHDDFTPLVPTLAPDSVADPYTRPVIVLVDRGCYSATSAFAVSTQAYDNILLLGDTTGGGLGLPTQGALPNGWIYRFPVTRTIALDGHNYENGVPPDIPLKFDRHAAQTLGRDNLIDSAVSLITTLPGSSN